MDLLSRLRLSVHHIQGVKTECADYISRNNFDDMIGARSEELAKEAFSRMDAHLDLNMTMIRLSWLKLHGQNHTKCTQFGPCKKIVFHRLCFSKTEY